MVIIFLNLLENVAPSLKIIIIMVITYEHNLVLEPKDKSWYHYLCLIGFSSLLDLFVTVAIALRTRLFKLSNFLFFFFFLLPFALSNFSSSGSVSLSVIDKKIKRKIMISVY